MNAYEYLLEEKKILEDNIAVSEIRCGQLREKLEVINGLIYQFNFSDKKE